MKTSKIAKINEMIIRCSYGMVFVIIDIQGHFEKKTIDTVESITVYDRNTHYDISVFASKKINGKNQTVEIKFISKYLSFENMTDDFELAEVEQIENKTKISKYWYWTNRQLEVKRHQYVNFYQIDKIVKPSNFSIPCPASVK